MDFPPTPPIPYRVVPGRIPTVTVVTYKISGLKQIPVCLCATPAQYSHPDKKD